MATKHMGARARPGTVLAAATFMGLPLGSIYAFSVLLGPLEELLQASRSLPAIRVRRIGGVLYDWRQSGAKPVRVGWCAVSCGSNRRTSAVGVILAAVAPRSELILGSYLPRDLWTHSAVMGPRGRTSA